MPNWVGDVVMALYALRGLREENPEVEIHIYCRPHLRPLFAGFQVRDLSLSSLLKERYDEGIIFTNSFSSHWLFFIGRVQKRRAKHSFWAGIFGARRILWSGGHHTALYQAIAGVSQLSEAPLWQRKKATGPFRIGINPGASYGSAKCWPPEYFRTLIRLILETMPRAEVRCFGSWEQRDLVASITEGFDARVQNQAGETSLGELIDEIAACHVFVTNDSGPMHIAAGLHLSLIALFGSTAPESTGPFPNGIVLTEKVECSPCFKRTCPIDFRCMVRLTPEKVAPLLSRKLIVILAGGKGVRLGAEGPKAAVEVRGKKLFTHLLEKVSSEDKVMVLTSPHNDAATREMVRRENLYFYVGKEYPSFNRDRSELYSDDLFPEGNGAFLDGLEEMWQEGLLDDVDRIQVVPIDNYRAPVGHKLFFETESDLVVLETDKLSPEEKMGVVQVKNRLDVREYLEGPIECPRGFTGIFSFKARCLPSLFSKTFPEHVVEKRGRFHSERFAFDIFPYFDSFSVVYLPREECFMPVKTQEDLVNVNRF